jgi:DNA-binding MarR family transcriptional regulator
MEELNKGIRVIKVLKQVMDTLKQNMGHQFKEMNITGPQGMLMGILAHDGEMKISDLSEKLGLSNSTVSGIVDRLEKQGLVERTRSEEDRRVVYVSVTQEFQKNAKERFNGIQRMFEGLMNTATPEEAERIYEGLNTLKKVMDRQKQQN